jgi:hypothetical protein
MELDRMIATPIQNLSASDFESLRSGRDRFSPMSLPTLEAILKRRNLQDEQDTITTAFPDPVARAKAFRWLLRGLDAQKTIRKVNLDLVHAATAHGREYNPL